MVDLVGSVTIDEIQEPLAAGEVPVMKEELGSRLIGIFVDVVNSLSMKSAGATDDAVYFITLGEQKFREVRAVLARDTGNDGSLHWSSAKRGLSTTLQNS
jgi:hypothetical protein